MINPSELHVLDVGTSPAPVKADIELLGQYGVSCPWSGANFASGGDGNPEEPMREYDPGSVETEGLVYDGSLGV